uniref:HAT C-terminal dimerisation domain-containing protein n=1 Tax=Latimeria chalumnae TaxID=7897 RepID=H2ZWT2_LATCH
VQLNFLGGKVIDEMLDDQWQQHILKHNAQVEKKSDVLKRFINIVCLLGQQELSFPAHDESTTSLNRNNYVGVAHFLSRYDDRLATHFSIASSVFTGLSNHIQNDIVQSVSAVILDFIKKELTVAPFVAIMMDETSDISLHSQLSIVFRYVDKDGKAQEWFVGFISTNRSMKALADMVFECLKEFQCRNKLVAKTYDGAAIMSRELSGLQAHIIDHVVGQMNVQFSARDHLSFLSLMDGDAIPTYTRKIPQETFSCLIDGYGEHFDAVYLKNELITFYARDEYPRRNAAEIMLYLKKQHLDNAFSELYKLCGLVLTIPATTASIERSFSTLKRIKTYSRSTTVSGLAFLSIEKGIMQKLQEKGSEFCDAVISEFTKKTHRVDFQFR